MPVRYHPDAVYWCLDETFHPIAVPGRQSFQQKDPRQKCRNVGNAQEGTITDTIKKCMSLLSFGSDADKDCWYNSWYQQGKSTNKYGLIQVIFPGRPQTKNPAIHKESGLFGTSLDVVELPIGGGAGIRTLGGVSPTTVFETVPISRSGTPPWHPLIPVNRGLFKQIYRQPPGRILPPSTHRHYSLIAVATLPANLLQSGRWQLPHRHPGYGAHKTEYLPAKNQDIFRRRY